MRVLFYILALIVIFFGIAFAGLNAQPITIHYFVGKSTLPLPLLLVVTLIIGCIMGLFAGLGIYIQQKRVNYQLRSRIKIAEQEISNLRSLPLKDSH